MLIRLHLAILILSSLPVPFLLVEKGKNLICVMTGFSVWSMYVMLLDGLDIEK